MTVSAAAPSSRATCDKNVSSERNIKVNRSNAANIVAWSVVENGGLALVSFVSLIVYSRFLSPSDFGLFSIVLALVELLGLLVTMLFHDVLVQRPGLTQAHFDTAFTFTLGLSLLLLGGCALFARTFAHWVNNPAAAPVLIVTALWFPCAALGGTIVPLQRRRLEFRPLAMRSLIGRLAGAAIGILLVVLGAGFWGLVAQYVLMALVGSLVLWIAAPARPRLRFHLAVFRSLASFSLYSVGGLFMTFAVSRVFTIVVGVALGTQAAGYLNLSFRMVDALWAIAATAIAQSALPVLARLQSDPERLKRAYGSALELTCLVLYPCFVGIALVAPELVEILFGHAWLVCTPYVAVLAFLILVRAPGILGRPLLTAVGCPQYSMISVGIEMLTMVTLIATFGTKSLPWAIAIWVAQELVPIPVSAFLLKRASGIRYIDQIRGTWAPLLASAGMCVAASLVRKLLAGTGSAALRLGLLVSVGAVAFVATAWLAKRASIMRALEFIRSVSHQQSDQVSPHLFERDG